MIIGLLWYRPAITLSESPLKFRSGDDVGSTKAALLEAAQNGKPDTSLIKAPISIGEQCIGEGYGPV